jgi:hypothetical protein
MKKAIQIFTFLLFPTLVIADAGYLGTVTQNPSLVVLPGKSLALGISMQNEEVVVELHQDYAQVTAEFAFDNHGPAQTVMMYLPLDIPTIFVSRIYYTFDDWKDKINIQVDGIPVAPQGLYQAVYDPQILQDMGLSWKEFAELVQALNSQEPAEGESFYFYRYTLDDSSPGFEKWNNQPLYPANMLAACWTVDFDQQGEKRVTCSYKYSYTQDYSSSTSRFTYPLYTGATWSGPITSGEIYVIPGDDFDWDDVSWVSAPYMPPAEELGETKLTVSFPEYDGKSYAHALLWKLQDFTPKLMQLSHLAYYPDIGSLGLFYQDDPSQTLPDDLVGSLIYIYTSSFYHPETFLGFNPQGTPLHQKPDSSSPLVQGKERIVFMEHLQYITQKDNWMQVEARDSWSPPVDKNTVYKGWIDLQEQDGSGRILPSVIPYIDSAVDNPTQ